MFYFEIGTCGSGDADVHVSFDGGNAVILKRALLVFEWEEGDALAVPGRCVAVTNPRTLTFGTRMAAVGVPWRTLQEWMGHSDFTTRP
jgi:hypothetical protein